MNGVFVAVLGFELIAEFLLIANFVLFEGSEFVVEEENRRCVRKETRFRLRLSFNRRPEKIQ